MVDPTDELRVRAEILQKRIASGDALSRARLRSLAELAKADDEALTAAATGVQRKHCLAVVARETGFGSWEHAVRVLGGDGDEQDFGTLLYDGLTGGGLNAWFVDWREARAHLDERRARGEGVYLLAYRRQFFVVERGFIEALGLDPADPDWSAIRFDWARPADPAARRRLYAKRLAVLRRDA